MDLFSDMAAILNFLFCKLLLWDTWGKYMYIFVIW